MSTQINNMQELLISLRNGEIPSERSGEYWEEDEKAKLRQMFWTGKGISEMAVNLQRSENAVIQQLLLMRVLTPRQSIRQSGDRRKRCPRCHGGCPCFDGGYCNAGAL